jgi:hypothetical protein
MREFIDGDFFESLADVSFSDPYKNIRHINFDEINSHFLNKSIVYIYVHSDRVLDIFNNTEKIKGRYVLITHNSDLTFNQPLSIPMNCIHWFGQNINFKNSRATSIPIGLERTIRPDNLNGVKNKLIEDVHNRNTLPSKLLYVNYSTNTNPSKRSNWKEYFAPNNWATVKGGISYTEYITDISEHKFILSPDGNGIDCHRTWEALYLGSIPIVEKSQSHINLYNDLPVLFVNSFRDVSEKLLHGMYNIIKTNEYNLDRLYQAYYRKLIKLR